MPWTFEGKLKTLWNKTLRWPGHFAEWRAYIIAGLLDERLVRVAAAQRTHEKPPSTSAGSAQKRYGVNQYPPSSPALARRHEPTR